jgi:potassium-dependent mechanosensitive channel
MGRSLAPLHALGAANSERPPTGTESRSQTITRNKPPGYSCLSVNGNTTRDCDDNGDAWSYFIGPLDFCLARRAEIILLYKPVIYRVSRLVVLFISPLIFGVAPVLGEEASPSPAKPNPSPTAIPLTTVPVELQVAMASLQAIDTSLAQSKSSVGTIAGSLLDLTSQADAMTSEDMRLLKSSPSFDMLHRLNSTWQSFSDDLSALAQQLTKRAASLEEERTRLDQFTEIWQATLQSTKQPNTPPQVVKAVQSVVDSIERTRQSAEAGRAQILDLEIRLSEEETRVRTALSSVHEVQTQQLDSLLVRDSPPIWSAQAGLSSEMMQQSSESFSSQLMASSAFSKRLPSALMIAAVCILVIASALFWMRRSIRKLADEKPDLQRALPILDVPVSTAFVLVFVLSPSLLALATSLVQAIIVTIALVPTVIVLRRLLERHLYPLINALVVLYFVSQLRILVSSISELARFIFLGQMLGASLFLIWLLRSGHLKEMAAETDQHFLRALRIITRIGLILLPAAFFANIFGYVNLGNLVGLTFLRSVQVAAILYAAVRIIEGLIIVALQVRPFGWLRVITLHRSMLQQRICRAVELMGSLFWLYLLLNFYGLKTPLIEMAQAGLNANLAIGSLNLSVGRILTFMIAVCASFLVSKFLRFLLEEDVYHHFRLASGVPYAISTMLHYAILVLGFFIALATLGIDLSQITLLAGALSVGIGFGLQNVINNFVSGLILLFERPIKIGDVIEVSGNVGEVRRIGIRASVIRTSDGSEVIVPNGSLISSQVTNWTFSDQQRAVEVSVNVIGGVDTQRVVELLKSVATAHPDVAKQPAPQVYIVNFTAGAVTFQLRVWTERSREWAQVRSDLAVAVNEALAREKIAIA